MESKKEIMHDLYVELVKLQKEIISSNLKLLIILEGRDAAGKDGTIKRLTKHLSPRETRIVALNKPSDQQQTEWYFQRYTAHLPSASEMVLFNRSWYNRAGVEKVMGFCTDEEYKAFFDDVALFEKMLTDAGIVILKYYLDISKKEQAKRLEDRKKDPLKQWKISPIDAVAQSHWKDYSKARDKMLKKTDFKYAPWFVVNANDKHEARIALISHILTQIDYDGKEEHELNDFNELVYAAHSKDIKDKLM